MAVVYCQKSKKYWSYEKFLGLTHSVPSELPRPGDPIRGGDFGLIPLLGEVPYSGGWVKTVKDPDKSYRPRKSILFSLMSFLFFVQLHYAENESNLSPF